LFPLIETVSPCSISKLEKHKSWSKFIPKQYNSIDITKNPINHILSHQKIIAHFITIELDSEFNFDFKECIAIKYNEVEKFPFPKLIENFIKHNLAE